MTADSSGYDSYEFVAEYYDAIYEKQTKKSRDVDFFIEYAKRAGGKTLELGCGTGRILVPTAAAGNSITGLDISEYMLQECRDKLASIPADVQARVRLVRGDMTDFNLGDSFALITIPFRAFQHLITEEYQKACLKCVHRHLARGGTLIIDVFHPSLPRLTDTSYLMEMDVEPEIKLPDGRLVRRTNRTAAFHPAERYNDIELIHYVRHPDGRQERLVHAFPMRYFSRREMEQLLKSGGFKTIELFGNYAKTPFTESAPEMIFVAQKAGE